GERLQHSASLPRAHVKGEDIPGVVLQTLECQLLVVEQGWSGHASLLGEAGGGAPVLPGTPPPPAPVLWARVGRTQPTLGRQAAAARCLNARVSVPPTDPRPTTTSGPT